MKTDSSSLHPDPHKWTGLLATLVILLLASTPHRGSCATAAPVSIPFSSAVPTDIADPADPRQAAQFAWQEFVALTWPAQPNLSQIAGASPYLRGQPSATDVSGGTGAGGVVVWETFYHRSELYPGYATGAGNVLPDPNALPSYLYNTATVTKVTPDTDLTLFNNLDETSEIDLANMYHTPFAVQVDQLRQKYPQPTPAQLQEINDAATKAAILYEAKGNPIIFAYLKSNSYNNLVPRRNALRQSIKLINNQPVTGPTFELPNGSIEMKATWRRYDPAADNLNDFHWTKAIYYTASSTSGTVVAHNDIMLLIGLHIIQKTPNVPSFTFATFEHVSNEQNGFRFMNSDPQTYTPAGFPRALPDPGVITAIRQYPIPGPGSPFDLVSFNAAAQAQLRSQFGSGNVWANYQLIGIQAVVQNDPGGPVPPQQFFLSNFATETNDSLQFFQGGLSGNFSNVPNPDIAHVYLLDPASKQYKTYTAGGCVGCHGSQGQSAGGDFSVIAATGNAFRLVPVSPYPVGTVVNQNPSGFPLPHSH